MQTFLKSESNSLIKNVTCNLTKTCPFLVVKKSKISFFDVFLIFAQNIDCGYTLEPPGRGGFNEYQQSIFGSKITKIGIPCKPQFYNNIKVGYEGIYIAWTCYPDEEWYAVHVSVAFGKIMHYKYACT